MNKFIDINGQQFGELVAMTFVGRDRSLWECRCSCGNTILVRGRNLRCGKTISCGCKGRRHGHAKSGQKTKMYEIWCAMKRRCYNKKAAFYEDYGGRGITVCDSWNESYAAFLADMGERPIGMSLDRKNNSGNYEPSNCHWTTKKNQALNRRSNVMISYNGKTQPLSEWAIETGIGDATLRRRMKLGWPVEKMLLTSVRSHKPYKKEP